MGKSGGERWFVWRAVIAAVFALLVATIWFLRRSEPKRLVASGRTATPHVSKAAPTSRPQRQRVFSLWIRGKTSKTAGSRVDFEPLFVTERPPDPPHAGPCTARLEDSAGKPVSRHPLPDGFDEGHFRFNLFFPYVPAARIVFECGGVELASLAGSKNRPIVTITSPQAGSAIAGPTLPLAWTAHDADGDALHALVLYSHDGGGTWETVTVDDSRNAIPIHSSNFPGSDNAILEVTVSDGFHSVSEQVGPFKLAKKAPTIWVERPRDGEEFVGNQYMSLRARAGDVEDRDLAGGSIVWASDVDGRLGASPVFTKQLSAGPHVITATATDSDGMTARDQVKITIVH